MEIYLFLSLTVENGGKLGFQFLCSHGISFKKTPSRIIFSVKPNSDSFVKSKNPLFTNSSKSILYCIFGYSQTIFFCIFFFELLSVPGYELQGTSCGLRVAGCELRVIKKGSFRIKCTYNILYNQHVVIKSTL